MTDDATTGADRLATLTTKLERESRATRYLLVVCTAANIAVVTFGVKVAYDWLPPIMLAHFMEHMQEVSMTWHAFETAGANQRRAQQQAATAGGDATGTSK